MRQKKPMHNRTPYYLTAIIILSVVLRLGAALYVGDEVVELPGTNDQITYHTLAQRVMGGHGFTFHDHWWPATPVGEQTAHWSYLYTFYLMGVYTLFGPHPLAARIIQAVLVGVLQPLLAYLLGRRIIHPAAGLLGALFTAIYTYFIYYSVALMTEPFFITAVMFSLYLSILLIEKLRPGSKGEKFLDAVSDRSHKRDEILLAIALGFSLAAALLLRQLILLFIPILLIWIAWFCPRYKLHLLLLPVLIIAGVILPFTVYNYSRFETFVLLNTNAGFALFWSNHPVYADQFEPILSGSYYQLIPRELRHLNEAALDKALLGLGLKFIIEDPARYMSLSISRIPALFQFWPSADSSFISNLSRVLSFGILLPFMVAGFLASIIRSLKNEYKETRPYLYLIITFLVFYILLHLLSWSLIRYRLPVDAILVIFAGYALVELINHIRERRLALDKTVQQPAHDI
jgi:4-amino-4-deoxy-L-arabinose transferase-like glycosyltransferase